MLRHTTEDWELVVVNKLKKRADVGSAKSSIWEGHVLGGNVKVYSE